MSSGFVVIHGGNFCNAAGQPYAGASLYATPAVETVVAGAGQISAQTILLGVLDSNGNLPPTKIWASDTVTPQGSVYSLKITDASGAPVYGPLGYYISGSSPINLNTFSPTSLNIMYPNPIVQNPVGDQTIQTNNLLPAAGNTTQSLGTPAAPWDATINNLVIQGSTVFGVVNATTGFQVDGGALSGNVLRGNGVDFVDAPLAAADLSNGVTGSGQVVLATNPSITTLTMANTITTYNEIPTVGNGVPSEYASVALANQSASIANTDMYLVPASGMYRVNFNLKVTQAATSSSSISFETRYTDTDGSIPIIASPAQTGNTLTSLSSGTFIIHAQTGTQIQYATVYASSGVTAMQYSIFVILEAL